MRALIFGLVLLGASADAAAADLAPPADVYLDLGRSYERLRDWQAAIDAYTHYVEATPTPLDADQVLQHIGELRWKRDQQPAPAAPRSWGRAARIAGAVVAAVGIGALGVGIGFGVAGNQAADAATARDRARLPYDAEQDRVLSNDRDVEGALLGVGAVLVAAGTVSLVLGYLHDRHAPAHAQRALPPTDPALARLDHALGRALGHALGLGF